MNELLLYCKGIGMRTSLFFIGFLLSFSGWAQTYEPTVTVYNLAGDRQDDFAPGETAVLKGTGWTQDQFVDVHLHEVPEYDHDHDYHNTIVDVNGNWEIKYPIERRHLGVTFNVEVHGLQSDYTASTVFTDADKHDIYFATAGLPTNTSVAVTWNGTNDNGNSFSGTTTFNSPGPTSANQKVTTEANTSFTFTFPVLSGYTLSNTSTSSPITTGAKNGTTTITGTYIVACTLNSGALTKSPNTSSVCEGTTVSATASSGSGGTGTIIDVLEYRYNGTGTWSAYTSGNDISTTGKTQVEIRTYRTSSGSGCINSTLNLVSWIVNSKPTINTTGILSSKDYATTLQTTTLLYSSTAGSPNAYSIDWNSSANTAGLSDQVNTPFSFSGGGGTLSGININPGTPAGTYSGTITLTNANSCISSQAVSLTIGKATPIISWNNPADITYGTELSGTQLNASSGVVAGNFVYSPASGTELNAGNEQVLLVDFIPTDINNYNSVIGSTVSLNVLKREIEITADPQSKTYGDSDPALTYQITVGSLAFSDAFTGSLTRDAGETVGAWPITQGDVALNSNYALTYVGDDLTIGLREVEITTDPQSKTYGDSDPALTYQITVGSLAFSDAFTGSLTRDAGETVGAWPITQGDVALNSNYALTYVGDDLTIGLREVEITADPQSKTYGDSDPALTYQITVGSLAFSDAFTGSLTRDAGETVGTWPITQGDVALNSNYALTYVGDDLTIGLREVEITADDKHKFSGQVDPPFTYQITDGILIGSDAFTGFLSRALGESSGIYTINKNTVSLNSNYSLSFISASLTIDCVTSIDATMSSTPVQVNNGFNLMANILPNVSDVSITFKIFNDLGVQVGNTYTGDTFNGEVKVPANAISTIGVYKVIATAGSRCAFSTAYIPVFDPNSDFVTGGGWIMSPEKAFKADETLTGKASFGFVSKYKKGSSQVDGNTEFQFKAGDLNFKSMLHESGSLVISGKKATYRGEGTINGVAGFKFMLVAIDGDWNGGSSPDQFRIKIWGSSGIVYDNGLGADDNTDASTVLGGGSIVIHKPKGKGQEDITKGTPVIMEDLGPEILETLAASPNPVVSSSTVRFSVKEDAMATLSLYDNSGRLIETLFTGAVKAFENYDVDFQRRNLMSGIYIVKLTTAKGHSYDKRIIIN